MNDSRAKLHGRFLINDKQMCSTETRKIIVRKLSWTTVSFRSKENEIIIRKQPSLSYTFKQNRIKNKRPDPNYSYNNHLPQVGKPTDLSNRKNEKEKAKQCEGL